MESRAQLLETAAALNAGAIHLLRGLADVDRRSGLTPARLSALSVLVFAGPRSIGRLADADGVASPTMTRIVDGLERLGLAVRSTHPDNGRISLVSATPAGRSLMLRAARRRAASIAAGLASLPRNEREAIVAAADAISALAAALPAAS